ncbi:MAG: hypothetical protein AMJ79_02220 [Phycisphaerae bacterium SM23_30]|nr:MAG: hypothetical protein AMJ79_02220 [Phycisphaerae bacterium SM23_30]
MVAPNKPNDYYYAHNHLYSPVALIDDEGDVLERYEYDTYGKPYFLEPNLALADTQISDYNNVILFNGRRVDFLDDDDLKLQYSRSRYYDYHTGRWLTHDQIGYKDGMNLYQYVKSNPVRYFDPFGLRAYNLNGWDDECEFSKVGETRTRVEIKIIRDGCECNSKTKIIAQCTITVLTVGAVVASKDPTLAMDWAEDIHFLDVVEKSLSTGTKLCVKVESKECSSYMSSLRYIFGLDPLVLEWEEEESYWHECEGGPGWAYVGPYGYDFYTDREGAIRSLEKCLGDLGIEFRGYE